MPFFTYNTIVLASSSVKASPAINFALALAFKSSLDGVLASVSLATVS